MQQSAVWAQDAQRIQPPTNGKMCKQVRWCNSQHHNAANKQDTCYCRVITLFPHFCVLWQYFNNLMWKQCMVSRNWWFDAIVCQRFSWLAPYYLEILLVFITILYYDLLLNDMFYIRRWYHVWIYGMLNKWNECSYMCLGPELILWYNLSNGKRTLDLVHGM